jgi:hypothetical protein
MHQKLQKIAINSFYIIFSIIIGLIFSEAVLRIKHSVNPNYDIEMWRYAKELKTKSSKKFQ